jgi:hypothetical protein
MIRKKNQINNIRIERVCLFSKETLEVNLLIPSNDQDEGELSWIYILDGELFVEHSKSKNVTTFITKEKLNDFRFFSDGFIKLTAGCKGSTCLLVFASNQNCTVKNLKNESTIKSVNKKLYILPLSGDVSIADSNKSVDAKNVLTLSPNRSVKFNTIDTESNHLLLIESSE